MKNFTGFTLRRNLQPSIIQDVRHSLCHIRVKNHALYGITIPNKALISAGLKLDGYGECFNRTIETKPWSTKPEAKTLFNQYKFYLAFENSIHCKDYISEKFWRNAIFSGSVPVVFGPHKEDVAALAPPNSFIHTDDFE